MPQAPGPDSRPLPDTVTVLGEPAATARPRVLVHALTGFLDAGMAPSLLVDHLDDLPHRELATFESDAFVDYRARRPLMTYERDHYEGVVMPQIALHELSDAAGEPFLLLTGPEPDFAWNRFVAAVQDLVRLFDVSAVVGVGAIPWPSPHTRPLDVSAHASDPSLVAGYRTWVDSLQIPGHVPGVLELRLGEAGVPAFGFAVHVPQYLAQYRYPQAALRLLRAVAQATDLDLPTEALESQAAEVEGEIAEYLAGSTELQELVAALEVRYDAVHVAESGWAEQDLPSGDEIAAALQAFLADQAGPDEPR